MLIATAGHVDHGKTLLVRTLTGVDTDRLPEEKKRGLTIDLGFAYTELGGTRVGFVDVPGHERFVHNMLAGVGAIDFALLVVAADDGVMPQTIEHLAILDLLGIERGLVVITKCDRVEASRLEEVREQLANLLAGRPLEDADVLAVSAMNGDNIPALREALEAAAGAHAMAANGAGFRLCIDRSFSVQGAGQVVTGAVFAGSVREGDILTLVPGGAQVRVRGIHANGEQADATHAGQRAALNVAGTGLTKAQLARGVWATSGVLGVATERFDASVSVLASEAKALKHWTPVHLHAGAWSDTARVAVLGGRQIAPGESGLVQLVPDSPLHSLHGDRFVLRDQSAQRTVGGGLVLDPFAEQRGRHKPARATLLAAHALDDAKGSLAALSAIADHAEPLARFAARRNLELADIETMARDLALRVVSGEHGPAVISADAWRRLASELEAAMKAFHGQYPDRVGASEAELVREAGLKATRETAHAALRELLREGVLMRDGAHVRAPTHRVRLTRAEQALWDRVAGLVTPDTAAPPVVAELAEMLDVERADMERFLRASAQRGMLVKVADNRYYHPDAIARHVRAAETLAAKSETGRFSAGDFRTAAGIGRNLAIQLLEHFDAVQLTRRFGNERALVRERR